MNVRSFRTPDALADWAANLLIDALLPPGRKSLMVTGGTGPIPIYDRLSRFDLDWSRVAITLSDDRFVDPSSPDSNEGMVREKLLQGHAAQAHFVPLKGAGPTPQDDADAAAEAVERLMPFDATLLGMGEDGHIASLFPNDPHAEEYLNPRDPRRVVGVPEAGMTPFLPRISFTMGGLVASKLIVLVLIGQKKRELFARSMTDQDFDPPVAVLMRRSRAPVHVLMAS